MRTSALLGRVLDGVVGGLALEELLAAAAGRHVLNAHMDALPDNAVADLRTHAGMGPSSRSACMQAHTGPVADDALAGHRLQQSATALAPTPALLPAQLSAAHRSTARERGCLKQRTCLFTSTPTARLVTFHTMPVLPWYTL